LSPSGKAEPRDETVGLDTQPHPPIGLIIDGEPTASPLPDATHVRRTLIPPWVSLEKEKPSALNTRFSDAVEAAPWDFSTRKDERA
jgi:hypothetical protein